jgi:hypothetical protein
LPWKKDLGRECVLAAYHLQKFGVSAQGTNREDAAASPARNGARALPRLRGERRCRCVADASANSGKNPLQHPFWRSAVAKFNSAAADRNRVAFPKVAIV